MWWFVGESVFSSSGPSPPVQRRGEGGWARTHSGPLRPTLRLIPMRPCHCQSPKGTFSSLHTGKGPDDRMVLKPGGGGGGEGEGSASGVCVPGLLLRGRPLGWDGGSDSVVVMTRPPPFGVRKLRSRKQVRVFGNLPEWGWRRPLPPWGSCKDEAGQAPLDFLLCLREENQMNLGGQWEWGW